MLFWRWWLAHFLPFFGVFCPQGKRGLRFRLSKNAPISGNFLKCKKSYLLMISRSDHE